jgi:hypothetical protein
MACELGAARARLEPEALRSELELARAGSPPCPTVRSSGCKRLWRPVFHIFVPIQVRLAPSAGLG